MTLPVLLLSAVLASNAIGKTLVRGQPGTMVPKIVALGPVFTPDANTTAHVWFDGQRLRDRYGAAWAMGGTVSQVARAAPVPAGANSFSDTNIYSVTSGLTASQNYAACFIFKWDGTGSDPAIFNDGAFSSSGIQVTMKSTTNVFRLIHNTTGLVESTANAASLSAVNVACGWRSGTTCYAQMNLGAVASLPCATHTAGPGPSQLGRNRSAGYPFTGGTLYEALFTSGIDSASVSALMSVARTKLGITAW